MRRLVLGGPGCGKTTRLLGIVDEALQSGIHPSRIAFTSFSRMAAYEARDRAVAKFGLSKQHFPHFRTLHSIAFRDAGFSTEAMMKSEDYTEIGDLANMDFTRFSFNGDDPPLLFGKFDGDKARFIEEQSRIRQTVPNLGEFDPWVYRKYVAILEEYKSARLKLDFTDLLERYVEEGIPLDVDLFIIDEAQDLSRLQWMVISRALGRARDVYFAGDDDQCIHTWCGADLSTFLSLDVKETEVLKHSWRIPRHIGTYAKAIASRIPHRYPKDWQPRDEDGSVNHYCDIDGIDYREGTWLLLARNKYLLEDYERAMRGAGVHYNMVGQDSPIRKYAEAIVLWEKLRAGGEVTLEEARVVYSMMLSLKEIRRGFKSLVGAPERMYDIMVLKNEYGLITTAPWTDALLKMPASERGYILTCRNNGERLLDAPRVRVGTIHSVKGSEADNVVLRPDVAWATYNSFQRGDDSEARVFYVGATRAKHNLFLLAPTGGYAYPL